MTGRKKTELQRREIDALDKAEPHFRADFARYNEAAERHRVGLERALRKALEYAEKSDQNYTTAELILSLTEKALEEAQEHRRALDAATRTFAEAVARGSEDDLIRED